ncbi:unnamed protein product [Triticum turgidum subsp. durum]|uniref:SDR family NAD(P)-dependent oxidoreductase n=1 Tax=Triticum turgidum subsp. durum TaxID=4567 RepID=A0A9R1QV45_TRITD|nr:unnamed protein product [Triticum turgidum subsp. durum]
MGAGERARRRCSTLGNCRGHRLWEGGGQQGRGDVKLRCEQHRIGMMKERLRDSKVRPALQQQAERSLAGKRALVTGRTKGIGRAIVEELAGFGVRVHTCSRSDADLHERLRGWQAGADAGRLRGRVPGSACDVSVRGDRKRLVATARAEMGGKLDILVNNAGQSFYGAATDYVVRILQKARVSSWILPRYSDTAPIR